MIETDIHYSFLKTTDKEVENVNKDIRKRQCLGIGQAEDAANVIAFLFSSVARFITEACILVDGSFMSN